MARSLNKVMLIGNIGSEPEVKTTGAGTKFAKVSIATNRQFKDRDGQQQEKTEWHRLTFWDRLAELVEQYVKKGDRIYVEGRIEYSTTEDDKGNQRFWTDITVNELVLLGGSSNGNSEQQPRPARTTPDNAPTRHAARRQPPDTSGRRPQEARQQSPFDAGDDDLPF